MKYPILLSLLLALFSSCENSAPSKHTNELELEAKAEDKTKPDDLSVKVLKAFVLNSPSIDFSFDVTAPFDTLSFDKVIAYDFNKSKRFRSIINKRGGFATGILGQKALTKEQVQMLVQFLTDPKTYGEDTFACFDPQLAFIFYEGEERKYVIDVCLDCNYLKASSTIPATQHKKMYFDDGEAYALKGFTNAARQKIVDLSKVLNFEYGNVDLSKLLSPKDHDEWAKEHEK